MIEITDSVDRVLWDEFVYNHPHGNIFQTSYMNSVYKNTKNYEPILLVAVDSKKEKILAGLQAVIIRESQEIIGLLTGRSIIIGGPLYIQQEEGYEAVQELLRHYEKIVRKKAVYTQIRNMWNTESIKNTIESAGYIYEDHLNYLIDLNQSSEKIWQNIKKSRRGDIKNAEKNGIKVKKIENLNEIKDFYIFIQETYKKSRLPLADISLFESSFNELAPKSMVDFYLATQNGNEVGSCVMLKYKNTIYNWYMGSKNEARYVDGALIWYILKENIEIEETFDFGGGRSSQKTIWG